jgi:LPS-assembly lipoprotein
MTLAREVHQPGCSRRQALLRLQRVLLLSPTAAAVGLGGCGFALRGSQALPFQRAALVGFTPRSSLERAVRTQLVQVAQVVDNPAQADVVIQALRDARERAVVAATAAGQVRELQLRVRLAWRASTPRGQSLIEPNELLLTRDLSYNESAALAKAQEAEVLYAAMDDDIAQQMMRRLASIKPSPR